MTTTAVFGLWVLAAIVVAAIWRGHWMATWRRVEADIAYLRALPTEQITDLDIPDPVLAELDEWPSLLYHDAWDASVAAWEYQMEVEECCGGRDKTCGHAR